MQFKKPKGDIFWWSLLWLAFGLLLVVTGPIRGDLSLTVIGIIAVATFLLVWFNQKWIAPPLIILYAIGIVARLIVLISKGFTLAGVGKLCIPVYAAYVFWEWYRSEDDTAKPILEGLTRSPTSPFDTPRADDHLSNPYRGNHPDEQ